MHRFGKIIQKVFHLFSFSESKLAETLQGISRIFTETLSNGDTCEYQKIIGFSENISCVKANLKKIGFSV